MKRAVERWLEWKGLKDSLVITRAEPDRVYAWPISDDLFVYCLERMELIDAPSVAEAMHGGRLSFRELASPSLQVVFHKAADGLRPYFLELDFDYFPPSLSRPHWLLAHAAFVLYHALTRSHTKEDRVLEMLERRIAREGGGK